MKRVGVIDYGSGNFGSVWNAMSSITADLVRVTSPDELAACSHIILPGVGAFAAAMKKIEQMGIRDELITQLTTNRKQFLGICVGMQVLSTVGQEFEVCAGLDLIKGHVEKINVDTSEFPLPHIGWNSIMNSADSPLFAGMEEEPTFYFVHSYCLVSEDREARPVYCEYGVRIVAAISKGNIHGVQFHPEKSQNNGLRLLQNFISL
jgi:glutamine amidotransferase